MSPEPFQIGNGDRAVRVDSESVFFIAGPCVVESRELCLRHAERVAEIADQLNVGVVFKASYDKANRTSEESYRGPGIDEGLRILTEAREATGLPVLTDVHETAAVSTVADAVDILQIPAFLCRQTDLIRAAATTGKPVNIKKGQFLAPWDMEHVLAKAKATGNHKIILTERGNSFGYGNLVNDFRSLEIMRGLGAFVVFDATHSVQMPGGQGKSSSGDRRYIAPLARAAAAVGINGVFMEVHENPDQALSDGPNSLPLEQMADLVRGIVALDKTRREIV